MIKGKEKFITQWF
jgi:hypothetical protein